jgi:hypothetical protein
LHGSILWGWSETDRIVTRGYRSRKAWDAMALCKSGQLRQRMHLFERRRRALGAAARCAATVVRRTDFSSSHAIALRSALMS